MQVKNDLYEILTPDGFSDFDGLLIKTTDIVFCLELSNNKTLKCTEDHLLKFPNGEFLEACLLRVGDVLFGGVEVLSINVVEETVEVFDATHVKNDSEYYTNGIVSHNCAFIDNIDTIYTAAKMTLATGGGCIALSTPNGIGNWFHATYSKAQKQENNFLPISLPWTVHPERDAEWRKQQDVDLGVRMAAQECDCDFATSGNTVVQPEVLTWYEENHVKEPINREGLDKSLWVWEYPNPMRYYMVVADVARGDGMDYSAYHVIDVDTLTQVAEYKSQIDTRYFANELVAIATKYNRALLVIENANIGWDVIQSVLESGYNNLHYSHRADNSADFQTYLSVHNGNSLLVPGFTMATKIRLNVIEKMRDYVENKHVVFRSIRLLDELKVFIWKNGKQQAMQGYNDDLVMSFAIGMFLRETSVRYKKAADSLTVSVMNSIGKSQADMGFYNSNSMNKDNPWNMKISAPGGDYTQDLTWLVS
jgi:hypothetical protein